jgi:hypothetical protein
MTPFCLKMFYIQITNVFLQTVSFIEVGHQTMDLKGFSSLVIAWHFAYVNSFFFIKYFLFT